MALVAFAIGALVAGHPLAGVDSVGAGTAMTTGTSGVEADAALNREPRLCRMAGQAIDAAMVAAVDWETALVVDQQCPLPRHWVVATLATGLDPGGDMVDGRAHGALPFPFVTGLATRRHSPKAAVGARHVALVTGYGRVPAVEGKTAAAVGVHAGAAGEARRIVATVTLPPEAPGVGIAVTTVAAPVQAQTLQIRVARTAGGVLVPAPQREASLLVVKAHRLPTGGVVAGAAVSERVIRSQQIDQGEDNAHGVSPFAVDGLAWTFT